MYQNEMTAFFERCQRYLNSKLGPCRNATLRTRRQGRLRELLNVVFPGQDLSLALSQNYSGLNNIEELGRVCGMLKSAYDDVVGYRSVANQSRLFAKYGPGHLEPLLLDMYGTLLCFQYCHDTLDIRLIDNLIKNLQRIEKRSFRLPQPSKKITMDELNKLFLEQSRVATSVVMPFSVKLRLTLLVTIRELIATGRFEFTYANIKGIERLALGMHRCEYLSIFEGAAFRSLYNQLNAPYDLSLAQLEGALVRSPANNLSQ